jgi:hypothetical protein
MNIALTPDIETALKVHADHLGTTPELVALDVLRDHFLSDTRAETVSEKHATLFDYLQAHIGVISSSEHVPGGARMSENCGKQFAAGLVKKRLEGKL